MSTLKAISENYLVLQKNETYETPNPNYPKNKKS